LGLEIAVEKNQKRPEKSIRRNDKLNIYLTIF